MFGLYTCVHNNKTWLVAAGCMFDKGVRHFYDDTCVVPEKAEGKFDFGT